MFRQTIPQQAGVEEPRRDYDLAVETANAATTRVDLLQQVAGSFESGTAAPITIESPEDGMLRNMSALPGQYVPSGAALFEVARLEQGLGPGAGVCGRSARHRPARRGAGRQPRRPWR